MIITSDGTLLIIFSKEIFGRDLDLGPMVETGSRTFGADKTGIKSSKINFIHIITSIKPSRTVWYKYI